MNNEKRRVGELLGELEKAHQQRLIKAYEHLPGHYQIHVIMHQNHTEETKAALKRHILKTYRDIERVDIGSLWVSVRYKI